jgi:hypothetical protein
VAAVEVDLDRQIAHDRRQPLAAPCLVDAGAERVLGARWRHLVQVGDDRLHAAELSDERLGRLLADSGHAWDVVGGIADQRLVVSHVLGTEPIARVDRRRVEVAEVAEAESAGEHHRRVVVDKLQQIAVAGDDDDAQVAAVAAGASQTADDVVRLEPGALLDRDVERRDQLPYARHLRPQIIRHRAAVRLVLGELRIAEGRTALHGDDRVVGLLSPEDVEQHRGETEHGVDVLATRCRNLVLDGVVGPKDQPVPVDQKQDWSFVARGNSRRLVVIAHVSRLLILRQVWTIGECPEGSRVARWRGGRENDGRPAGSTSARLLDSPATPPPSVHGYTSRATRRVQGATGGVTAPAPRCERSGRSAWIRVPSRAWRAW